VYANFCADHQPNGQAPVSSTAKAIQAPFQVRLADGLMAPFPEPRVLATHEIPLIVQQFKHAAKNAIAAGEYNYSLPPFNSFPSLC